MLLEPPDWYKRAACSELGHEMFFELKRRTEALAVCEPCPVRRECLAHALAHESFGVWGGTTPKERRELRRQCS